jgi:peptidyl-tRNA hydrolase, PTH1 family
MLLQFYRKFFKRSSIQEYNDLDPSMKYLIVGIGNIGEKYYGTRHNIGFEVVDYLLSENDQTTTVDTQAMIGSIKYKGKQVYLIKPTTYVNLSGKALKYWMQKLSVPIENVLVVVDDLHLDLGTLRLRLKGSDAGHNGLKNIQDTLGNNNYPRLRFGIGSDFRQGQQVDFVLGKWKNKEIEELQDAIPRAAEMVLSFVAIGPKFTMDKYNK